MAATRSTSEPAAPPPGTPAPDGVLTPVAGGTRWTLTGVPPQFDRVPYVRHQVALVLGVWQLADLAWATQLAASELVTNVVLHARTPFSVTLAWDGRTLRCEVVDVTAAPPVPDPTPTVDQPTGRGLLLVSHIAHRWGYQPHGHGKSIWFELTRDGVPR